MSNFFDAELPVYPSLRFVYFFKPINRYKMHYSVNNGVKVYMKKYIVRLSTEERVILEDVIKKLKGGSQKAMRAKILLKADANGSNWPDEKIAEAYGCRVRTIENVRKRLLTEGFEVTLNGKKPPNPPRTKLLSGEQEAELIAMRLGTPPAGYGSWTLKLLRDQMIALEIVETISHETVRQTLKKTDSLVKK
jgi:homeodomain-containing protein